MDKKKKFVTVDGNTAAAHVSYMWMNGLLRVAKIYLARLYQSKRWNRKEALLAPSTVLCRLVR